jgi:hypothetical protein
LVPIIPQYLNPRTARKINFAVTTSRKQFIVAMLCDVIFLTSFCIILLLTKQFKIQLYLFLNLNLRSYLGFRTGIEKTRLLAFWFATNMQYIVEFQIGSPYCVYGCCIKIGHRAENIIEFSLNPPLI